MPYTIRLKRKGAGVIRIEVNGIKITFLDGTNIVGGNETIATLVATAELLAKENLEWIRVEEAT